MANETNGNNGETGNLPATVNKDLVKFEEIRQSVVRRIGAVLESLEDEKEIEKINNLILSANPVQKGREEMDARWQIPIVRIVQGVTKEKPDNAKVGDIYDTNGYVHPQPFQVVPLYVWQSNRMFASKGSGGAPVCFSPDAKLGTTFGHCMECKNCPIGQNMTGEITDCENGVCFVALSHDLQLYKLEFYRTSRKAGIKLDGLANASRPYWGRWFNLTTEKQVSQDRNEWHIFKAAAQGDSTSNHVQAIADALYDMIRLDREVMLRDHYNRVLKGESAMSNVQEDGSIDDDTPKTGGTDDNPDVTDSGI